MKDVERLKDDDLMKVMECCLFDTNCVNCPLNYMDTTADCLMCVCKSAMELITKKQLEIEKMQRNERDIIREFADKVICQIARNHTISAEWMRNYLREISEEDI